MREEEVMEALQAITSFVVSIAATMYIGEQLAKIRARSLSQRIDKMFERHERETKKHYVDAEASVELWWSETGKDRVIQHLSKSVNANAMEPIDTMIHGIYVQRHLQSVKASAHALAAHLLSGDTHEWYIQELAKIKLDGVAEQITEVREKIQQHGEAHSNVLLQGGIDLEAFEAYFAPSQPDS